MKDSSIEWTHHSFNPFWGCQKVSPGCEHCYAETFARRLGKTLWGPGSDRKHASEAMWKEPLRWARRAKERGRRERVFCASMADVFEDRPDLDAARARLFKLIESTPELDWLLLTKRPQNMLRMVPAHWDLLWPKHVWAGCTVEDQRRASERIPDLARVPAVVRFVSCEPLLEAVDLRAVDALGWNTFRWVSWVIVGGESGPGARPMRAAWAQSLRSQCEEAGAHFFFKQWGGTDKSATGRLLDGRTWDEVPLPTREPGRGPSHGA